MSDLKGFQSNEGVTPVSAEPLAQETLNSDAAHSEISADLPPFLKNVSTPVEKNDSETPQEAQKETSRESYEELYDRYIRLAADFENFRKRQSQEYAQIRQHGLEMTLYELLPVLDNLDRARSALSETSDPKILFQSFRMLSTQLSDGLATLGVKKMDSTGKPFDPALHEAIGQQESSEHPENTILVEQSAGYCVNDKVIRPAQVLVAVKPVSSNVPDPSASGNPFEQVDISTKS